MKAAVTSTKTKSILIVSSRNVGSVRIEKIT
jgi:hypothetical protein